MSSTDQCSMFQLLFKPAPAAAPVPAPAPAPIALVTEGCGPLTEEDLTTGEAAQRSDSVTEAWETENRAKVLTKHDCSPPRYS